MTAGERFEQVERLYHLALEKEPGERAEFLRDACGDDESILKDVQSLLAREEHAHDFLEEPALEVAAEALAHEPPSLVGRRLGPYDILGLIGAGGMGEVYRARDTRLDRALAIKVLPPGLAQNPERRMRFEREAQAVSSLNHPHICTLHDVGSQDEVDFLVMEYLEGETLAAKLKRGSLPLRQALRFATEITAALDHAHRHGVIHRDLKPGNIILTKAGVKVLDFGLAKIRASDSPSRTSGPQKPLTEDGVILGTLPYMAPEQLRGEPTDARTDIFALGAVIFEMVTGRKVFEGDTRADLFTAILEHEAPSISKFQPSVPAALDHLVATCLVKDPDARRQTAHDVLLEMRWIAEGGSPSGTRVPLTAGRTNRERLAWALVAVLLTTSIAVAILHFREKPAEMRDVRFSISPPEKASFGEPLAISPDGTRLALIVSAPGKEPSLWIRRLDSLAAQPLAGTEGAHDPFWSPDGQFIAFFAQGKLRKIDTRGGASQILCDAPHDHGGTWSREGVILFGLNDALSRVPEEGGRATAVTVHDNVRFLTSQMFPQFLPDGRHFIYLHVHHQHEKDGIYLGSLDSKEKKRLLDSHWMAAYAPASGGRGGYLLFAREGSLMAQPFDSNRLELTGKPIPVAEGIESNADVIDTYFSVSGNGTLAYRPSGHVISYTQLTWFDRTGKKLGTAGLPRDHHPALSPDGKRLAVMRYFNNGSSSNIWLLDLVRGGAMRLTFSTAMDEFPIWSPDGRHIAFTSNREGRYNLYQRAANGAGDDELLLKSDEDKAITDWSKDGRFLVYNNLTEDRDISVLPIAEGRKPILVLGTQFFEGHSKLSPDGQWMVYMSNESGRGELYVRPFKRPSSKENQATGEHWMISTQGGGGAQWPGDGKEVFYNSGGKIMAVLVKAGVSQGRPAFEAGVPKLLFDPHGVGYDKFAVTADGQRFLVNIPIAEEKAQSVNVVLNWTALLK